MISHLDGVVISVDRAGRLELEVGPVCFELAAAPGCDAHFSAGDSVRVYTHLAITAEKLAFYGFATAEERDLFRLLLTASGVGPKIALSLVSLSAPAVARAIATGESRLLTAAPGVGAKLAEKIIVELRDKIGELAALTEPPRKGREQAPSAEAADGAFKTAVAALLQLGFPNRAALKAVSEAEDEVGAGADAAELIKAALRRVRA
ncbi:MAG: Holliday junction branch migration protein RuvA [bacterium]|jgi:Holliday junction DNA helicase RuvA